MPTQRQEDNMRDAIRLLHNVEIVGTVHTKWWPYVAQAIGEARRGDSSCSSCGKVTHLCRTSVAENPDDDKDGTFFHLCKFCGDTPEAVEEARLKINEIKKGLTL